MSENVAFRRLHLNSHGGNHRALIQKLIQHSRVIHLGQIDRMTPLYIMNISDYHPQLTSLVIDLQGQTWHSKHTPTRLAETYFSCLGYRHDTWQDYLRYLSGKPRTTFPYVFGNKVFIRLTSGRRNYDDWLNLTYCNEIKLDHTSQPQSTLSTITTYFNLPSQSSLQFRMNLLENLTSALKQIGYAHQISQVWHYYIPYFLNRLGHSSDLIHINTPFSPRCRTIDWSQAATSKSNLTEPMPYFNIQELDDFFRIAPATEYTHALNTKQNHKLSLYLKTQDLDLPVIKEALETYKVFKAERR